MRAFNAFRILLPTAFVVVLLCPAAFAQNNPVPFVNPTLQPTTVLPGSAGLTLTVNGNGFVSGSVVNWNRSPRATSFASGTRLTATILAADVAQPGTAWITVTSPAPGGGTSGTAFFQIATQVAPVLLSAPTMYSFSSEGNSVAVGDFNGDSKLDLVTVVAEVQGSGNQGTVAVLLGKGGGTFQNGVTLVPQEVPGKVYVGDVNGDGKADLLVTEESATGSNPVLAVYLGNGDGTFESPINTTLPGIAGLQAALCDLNGDGKLDMAAITWNNQSPQLTVLLGNGDGTFQSTAGPPANPRPYSLVAGDFNGDGNPDMVVGDVTNSTIYLYLGNGDGTFQPAVLYPIAVAPGGCLLAVADVNGDGLLDLTVTINEFLVALLNNGAGGFDEGPIYDTGVVPGGIVIGDFNGDGKVDVAAANYTISLLLGNGDGTFQSPNSFANTNINSQALVAGDFNGDGRPDLAVGNGSANTVSVLLQQASPAAALSPTSLNFAPQLIGTTSPGQHTTLTNSGNESLAISSVIVTGRFQQSSNCTSTLQAGASCTVTAKFKPLGFGQSAGAITITDDAPVSPQTVSLSGTGYAFQLSATSLNFGSVPVGQTSGPQTVTVTNLGKNAQTVVGIRVSGKNSGAFAETNNCGSSLGAGATCTTTTTFTPKYAGSASANLEVSGGGAVQTVSLSGTGTQ